MSTTDATLRGNRQVAAFFDIDGTLLAPPSLERQFFAGLRRQRAIPLRNYFLWLAESVRLMPRGLEVMRHANKMYLRGVRIHGSREDRYGQAARQDSAPAEVSAPRFLTAAMDRIAWHAQRGHAIVLVSGTLAPLAMEVGLALTMRLAVREVAAMIAVCATQLEESGGRWTGRIVGDAMFGEVKGRAVRRMICENKLDAQDCYAYGNSLSDCSMLEAVGQPVAVNPSTGLARVAREKKWPMLMWTEAKNSTQNSRRTQSGRSKTEELWEKVG
jgi:HAD superfamily hydrolase (TIGR01490 family)